MKPPRRAGTRGPAGMIDYTEFCEVLQVDPSPQGERLFQLFDYEKSGQIDVREFMIALSNFTGAGKDDKLKFAFMIFDEDGRQSARLKFRKFKLVPWLGKAPPRRAPGTRAAPV